MKSLHVGDPDYRICIHQFCLKPNTGRNLEILVGFFTLLRKAKYMQLSFIRLHHEKRI